jgi:hypothetical protein
LRALEVIGEAAKRIPPETQARFADMPWRQIVGMRNVIAHDYLGIRLSRIYETATVFIPQLQSRLPDMIAELESDRQGEDAGRSLRGSSAGVEQQGQNHQRKAHAGLCGDVHRRRGFQPR